jgi:transmembrane sensor
MNNSSSSKDRLIARWLADDLGKDEEKEFLEWLETNPEIVNEIYELKDLWIHTGLLKIPAGKNKNYRWEKLNAGINQRSGRTRYYYWAAAAAVLIITFFAVFYINSNQVLWITQNAEIRKMILPDRSVVIINSASDVKYNHLFWITRRTLFLEGEAFFKVEKSNKPFFIKCGNSSIEVLGTEFNVKLRNNTLTVACLKGKVKIINKSIHQEVFLQKGEACILKNKLIVKRNFDVKNQMLTSWINKTLFFDHTPLSDVFEEIERFYNVEIVYNESLNLNFSGTFRDNDINEVLETICKTANLQYTRKDITTIVIGKIL